MKRLITGFLTGYLVLAVAIAINWIAMTIGLVTWYGLFGGESIGAADGLFLFLFYPLALGLAGLLGVGAAEKAADWIGQR